MLRHRRILLSFSLITTLGSLAVTLSYAIYLRSHAYRRSVEVRVSTRLGMPLTIGSIEPLTLRARRFHDLAVQSARREIHIFGCRTAIWQDESTDSRKTYSLGFHDGWLLVGTTDWDRVDYESMLRTGLGHDFFALRIGRVDLQDIDLKWSHPDFTVHAPRCDGEIVFDRNGLGRATLQSDRLNEFPVEEPIIIEASFTPGSALRFHHVRLTVPEVPLAALNLDGLVGSAVTQGGFTGEVVYRERGSVKQVSIRGRLSQALIREFTAKLPLGHSGLDGTADLQLDDATFSAGALQSMRFSGSLDQLRMQQFAGLLGIPDLDGHIDLTIHQASYGDRQLKYASAEGRATNVSLDALTRFIGQGQITGNLRITIESLLIVDDQLVAANATIEAVPPLDSPGRIDRHMLQTASLKLLGLDATTLLPANLEHLEYTRLGLRLDLNRGQLRILGLHGDDGRTILTVKVLGREFDVIKETRRVYNVQPWIDALRERMRSLNKQHFQRWWESTLLRL